MDQEKQDLAIYMVALAGMLAMTAVMMLAPDTVAAKVAAGVREGLRVLADTQA